ncbi:MAG: hypothetical protein HY805_01355 [Nitrospirae bacterium]|nr:hypothetical protein [Nitrospirota bacterium]
MDSLLKQAVDIATSRGSKYVKGDVSLDELPSKMAELGIFLLSRVNHMKKLDGGQLREELNELQNKLDDLRKTVFNAKAKKL